MGEAVLVEGVETYNEPDWLVEDDRLKDYETREDFSDDVLTDPQLNQYLERVNGSSDVAMEELLPDWVTDGQAEEMHRLPNRTGGFRISIETTDDQGYITIYGKDGSVHLAHTDHPTFKPVARLAEIDLG